MKDFKYYQNLAEKGDAEAEYILGMEYLLGVEVEENRAIAMSWLEKASGHGSPQAKYLIGLYCLDDKSDVDRAIQLFKEAAEKKYGPAQYMLGVMSFWGTLGAPLDIDLAKECFEKASKMKSSDAQNMLGVMHYYGIGYSQDYAEAMTWFSKGAKRKNLDYQLFRDEAGVLDAPSPQAQVNLSAMYMTGEGGFKNSGYASQWKDKSTELGVTSFLYDRSAQHIETLTEEGAEFVSDKVIEQDDSDFIGKHIALWCFQYSRLVYGASYVLGMLFTSSGRWVTTSSKGQEDWCLSGAKQGDLRAKIWLAEHYSKTKARSKIKKAIKWMDDEVKRDGENIQVAQLAGQLKETLAALGVSVPRKVNKEKRLDAHLIRYQKGYQSLVVNSPTLETIYEWFDTKEEAVEGTEEHVAERDGAKLRWHRTVDKRKKK